MGGLDLDGELDSPVLRLALGIPGTRRRPRGVTCTLSPWVKLHASGGALTTPVDRTSLGVGGDERAIVWPEDDETGEDRASLADLETCNSEKQAGKLDSVSVSISRCHRRPQDWFQGERGENSEYVMHVLSLCESSSMLDGEVQRASGQGRSRVEVSCEAEPRRSP